MNLPIITSLCMALLCLQLNAQSQQYEWKLPTTGTSTGKRVVAKVEGTATYAGMQLHGQVVDYNGNWGFALPTVANFSVFIKIAQGVQAGIVQDVKTENITLKILQASATEFYLVADCPNPHKAVAVYFRKPLLAIDNHMTVTLGDPNTTASVNGTELAAQPTYKQVFSENLVVETKGVGASSYAVSTLSNGKSAAIFSGHDANIKAMAFRARNTGEYDDLYIKEDGKVGIGTTDPKQPLHSVGHNTLVQLRLERTGSYEGFCDLGGSEGDFRVWPGGYEKGHSIVMKGTTGNVGIGTISPTERLQIKGGGLSINDRSTFSTILGTSANSWLRDSWITCSQNIGLKWDEGNSKWTRTAGEWNDVGGIFWQDEGTYFLRIPRSADAGGKNEWNNQELLDHAFLFANIYTGNVGIGTSKTAYPDGTYKLAVNGKIRAHELKVTVSSWADHVFHDDYPLPALEEVEEHILTHRHLAGIPAEQDVLDNGVSVGDMNARLLQKIEEMTLYMIEFNKQLKALKTENDRLKEQMALTTE